MVKDVTKRLADQGPQPVRRRGRPKAVAEPGTDATIGRDALIDTVIELLKTLPPSSITPVVVARAIGVHPSLIRYYFKNRATMLVAVAERLTRQFTAQVEEMAQSDGRPQSRLFARVSALIDLNATYPFFHQLFASEIATSDDPVAREMVAQFTLRGQAAYGAIMRSGLADGSFRGVDSGLLYVAIVALSAFFTSAHRQLETAQGVPLDEKEFRAAYKAFVCDLILKGVESA